MGNWWTAWKVKCCRALLLSFAMIHRTNSMSVESLFYHLSNKQRLFVTEFFFCIFMDHDTWQIAMQALL